MRHYGLRYQSLVSLLRFTYVDTLEAAVLGPWLAKRVSALDSKL